MSFFDRLRRNGQPSGPDASATPGEPSSQITLLGNAGARVILDIAEIAGMSLRELQSAYGARLGLTSSNVAWKFEGNTLGSDVVPSNSPGGVYRAFVNAEEKGQR